MYFYLIVAFVLFFISCFDFNFQKNKANVAVKLFSLHCLLLITFFLVMLGGIRWKTGTDWEPYLHFFEENVNLKSFLYVGFEPGFSFFNFSIKHFTDSYTIYLFIFHFLVIVPKIYFVKKVSYYPLVSILLYWCIYSGDVVAVRNSLAVSFLLLSIFEIQNKNKKQFILFTLLATSIHYSSIMWFFSYYIYNLNIKKKTWIKLLLFSIFLAFVGNSLYPPIIKKLFSGVDNSIAQKIVYYATDYKEPIITPLTRILSLLKRLIFIPFIFIFYKRMIKLSPFNKGLTNLYLFGNVFYLAFFSGFTQMNRCVIANLYLEIILLPDFICCIKKKYLKMLFIFLVFFYGLFKMIMAIRPFSDVLIPFYTLFNYQSR